MIEYQTFRKNFFARIQINAKYTATPKLNRLSVSLMFDENKSKGCKKSTKS